MSMDIMGSLGAFGGGLVGYIVPFLFVLTIVVFFHELGHFLVARWCGIKVLAFSIGFGPEIVGFNDRYGTRWKISAVPLGGYVKFFGDDNAASVPDHEAAAAMSEAEKTVSFVHQPVGPRAAVVAAGPIANFILAIVIFAGDFHGRRQADDQRPRRCGAAGSAAQAAGFKPGDLVLAIDGEKIDSFCRHAAHRQRQRRRAARISRSSAAACTSRSRRRRSSRSSRTISATCTGSACSASAGRWRPATSRRRKSGRCRPSVVGAQETWFVVDRTLSYIGGVFAGREAADQLGGPIRIAQVSGQVAIGRASSRSSI